MALGPQGLTCGPADLRTSGPANDSMDHGNETENVIAKTVSKAYIQFCVLALCNVLETNTLMVLQLVWDEIDGF